jgi:hypothetical protein
MPLSSPFYANSIFSPFVLFVSQRSVWQEKTFVQLGETWHKRLSKHPVQSPCKESEGTTALHISLFVPPRIPRPLGQVESPLPLLDSNIQTVAQDFQIRVVWKLEIIDTGHDAWQIVVRRVWRLTRLADDGEHWCKALKSCQRYVSPVKWYTQHLTYRQSEAWGCQ